MAGTFAGKVVVVTGASRGIGFGIAEAFAREGGEVAIAASSTERLAAAAAKLKATAGRAPLAVAGDLRTVEGCEALHADVSKRFGRCDILVSSAGATKAGGFLAQPDADWHDGFALKFFSFVRLARLFWPMLKASQGSVVAVIGGAARTPDPDFLVGGSVNAAMHNFTKGLAGLGKRDGVTVNAILPGMTETERVTQLMQQRAAANNTTPDEVRRTIMARDGLSRLAAPEDIAALALFLAGPDARHIQGTAIAVDGGATAGVY